MGRISNFSKVLAHQPAALAGWMLPNGAIRLDNVKGDPGYVQVLQLVIIKTSALNNSAYCLSHNVPLGRKIGLSEQQIAATRGNDTCNRMHSTPARRPLYAGPMP